MGGWGGVFKMLIAMYDSWRWGWGQSDVDIILGGVLDYKGWRGQESGKK